jgi:hypothetical protein
VDATSVVTSFSPQAKSIVNSNIMLPPYNKKSRSF